MPHGYLRMRGRANYLRPRETQNEEPLWGVWFRRPVSRTGALNYWQPWHFVDAGDPLRSKCGMLRIELPTDQIEFMAPLRDLCAGCFMGATTTFAPEDRAALPKMRAWFESIAKAVRPTPESRLPLPELADLPDLEMEPLDGD